MTSTAAASAGGAGVETLGATAPLFSLDHTEFEAALAADHVNVEDTAHKLSRSDFEAAIDAIVSAEKVLIAGTDQMAFFASYLRHLLMLLDLRAEIVASPSQEALGRLSRIDDGTLVVGLSAGRPHPLITRTMKLARHRKARTLAITDATLSEVARLARIRLYYSSNTPAFVRSHTALLSIDPGARLRGLLARRPAVRRAHQSLPPQVAHAPASASGGRPAAPAWHGRSGPAGPRARSRHSDTAPAARASRDCSATHSPRARAPGRRSDPG